MGIFDPILKPLEDVLGASLDATIDFRNSSDDVIKVVMDNNRETHTIAPHGATTFSEANVGDMPTFRVYNEDGEELYGRKINPAMIRSSLGWNGKTF